MSATRAPVEGPPQVQRSEGGGSATQAERVVGGAMKRRA